MAPLLLLLDLYERMAATSKRKAQLDEIVVSFDYMMRCHVLETSYLHANMHQTVAPLKMRRHCTVKIIHVIVKRFTL